MLSLRRCDHPSLWKRWVKRFHTEWLDIALEKTEIVFAVQFYYYVLDASQKSTMRKNISLTSFDIELQKIYATDIFPFTKVLQS